MPRDGPTFQLPNNEMMSTTITGNTHRASISSAHAKRAHIFDDLHSASLMSLCQMCDYDCVAILEKNEINILKDKTLILKGRRNKTDGLWDIPISRPARHCAMEIITKDKKKTELIQYNDGFCFSPKPRTLLKVIKNGNFLTWPDLSNQKLLKHLHPSIAAALVHLDQGGKTSNLKRVWNQKWNLRKTAIFTHELCATIIPFNTKIKGFSDLTGAFPHKSSKGNLYFMVMYDYDRNAIMSEPI